jgi:hypothetical protein
MAPLRFRAWDKKKNEWYPLPSWGECEANGDSKNGIMELNNDEYFEWLMSTGLKDKNSPCAEVFEGDILSFDGKVIGNQWQNPSLLEDSSNLLVEGLGTEDWFATHKEAVDRGCTYPKRHAN